MKFGVNLINFGPSANPARLKSWAQLTEALGYHHLLISDHIAVTTDVATKYPAPFYELSNPIAQFLAEPELGGTHFSVLGMANFGKYFSDVYFNQGNPIESDQYGRATWYEYELMFKNYEETVDIEYLN